MIVYFVGKGTGHLNIRANVDGIIQTETYEVIDAIFYDPATTDRNTDYYFNSNYVTITHNTSDYTLACISESGMYVDVRGLTNDLLDKKVTVSVDVECGTLEARLRILNGSSVVSSSEYATGTSTLTLENVQMPSSSPNLIFRLDVKDPSIGKSIKFKNVKIYPV